jgi:hypothetical protein
MVKVDLKEKQRALRSCMLGPCGKGLKIPRTKHLVGALRPTVVNTVKDPCPENSLLRCQIHGSRAYRGASLIRTSPFPKDLTVALCLGPYGGPGGGGVFL